MFLNIFTEFSIHHYSVSVAFISWGIILGLACLIGALIIQQAPVVKIKENHSNFVKDYTRIEILKSPQAWLLFLALYTSCMTGLYVIGSAVDMGINMADLTVQSAANTILVIAVSNTLGRLILGSISDKLGYERTLLLSFFIMFLCVSLLLFTTLSYITFAIAVLGIGFTFGGNLSVFPAIAGKYFGLNNHDKNYCLIYQGFGLGSITGGEIALLAGFKAGLAFMFILLIISFIMLALLKAPKEIRN